MMWGKGMAHAPEAKEIVEDWLDTESVGVHADMAVKEFMSDNDPKSYGSNRFKRMFIEWGIKDCSTPEYKAAYNGIAEE